MKSLFLSTNEFGTALNETGWFCGGLFLPFPPIERGFRDELEMPLGKLMCETVLSIVAAVEELKAVDGIVRATVVTAFVVVEEDTAIL